VTTGAFAPFGQVTQPGAIVRGQVPCSGAILRIPATGGKPELVAWGFRNPFGLAFSPDGALYATDNGYDDRGSRPVHGAGDLLWRVDSGHWYGWPDYHGHRRLDDGDHYTPSGKPVPAPVLADPPERPPQPVAVLAVHSSSDGFDVSRSARFGYAGRAFIAQFGDQVPTTGWVHAPVGFKVVMVDLRSGEIDDFAVNRGKMNGPASWLGGGGLERPIAARFDPSGDSLYVVDFGVLTMSSAGARPQPGTGALWRIHRSGS
jgi:glucose/arabinose dehydrogenase